MLFSGDYKTQFKNEATRIVRQNIESHDEKNTMIDALVNIYINQIGERPDIRELDDLASWLIFGTKGVSMRKKMEIKALEIQEKRDKEAFLNG